jgi:hypothetical protein
MRPQPPSTAAWMRDGEFNGHTVEQTIRYLSDCDDWQADHPPRLLHPDVISVSAFERPESRLTGWLRRHGFGR